MRDGEWGIGNGEKSYLVPSFQSPAPSPQFGQKLFWSLN